MSRKTERNMTDNLQNTDDLRRLKASWMTSTDEYDIIKKVVISE